MDLVIFVKSEDKLIRVSEGDGCNLSQEDIDTGYIDYLYYDVYDIQELSDVYDGGMIMLENLIPKEFYKLKDLINRVMAMVFGRTNYANMTIEYAFDKPYQILSGEEYWKNLVEGE